MSIIVPGHLSFFFAIFLLQTDADRPELTFSLVLFYMFAACAQASNALITSCFGVWAALFIYNLLLFLLHFNIGDEPATRLLFPRALDMATEDQSGQFCDTRVDGRGRLDRREPLVSKLSFDLSSRWTLFSVRRAQFSCTADHNHNNNSFTIWKHHHSFVSA